MKNIRTIFTIVLVSVFFGACEKTEPIVFDPNSGQTLAFFRNNSSNLEVVLNSTGTDTVKVGLTTLSNQDRTVTVSLVEDQTTAASENFTIQNNEVIIPAGEYFGDLIIEGNDTSLEIQAQSIVLKLETVSPNGVLSEGLHTVSIFQICPIEPTAFVGEYFLEQLTPINPDDGVQVFENQIVTLETVEGASTKRQFSAVYLEALGIGQPPTTVSFSLSCDVVIVDSGIDTFLLCVQSAPTITLGPAEVPSNFDITDDSFFELTLTEYVTDGGCGVAPYQVTFSLTKQ